MTQSVGFPGFLNFVELELAGPFDLVAVADTVYMFWRHENGENVTDQTCLEPFQLLGPASQRRPPSDTDIQGPELHGHGKFYVDLQTKTTPADYFLWQFFLCHRPPCH